MKIIIAQVFFMILVLALMFSQQKSSQCILNISELIPESYNSPSLIPHG
jgi:hypothetical protein